MFKPQACIFGVGAILLLLCLIGESDCRRRRKRTNSGGGGGGGAPSGGGGVPNTGGCLDDANYYRLKHRNTGRLTWDSGLAAAAKRYADKLIQNAKRNPRGNPLQHDSRRGRVGENLWYWNNPQTGNDAFYCKQADRSWYNEINQYSYRTARSTNGKAVGHFTQMVWKDSQRVGYGVATARSGRNTLAIVVARYSPTGNINMRGNRFNDYSRNVQPLR